MQRVRHNWSPTLTEVGVEGDVLACCVGMWEILIGLQAKKEGASWDWASALVTSNAAFNERPTKVQNVELTILASFCRIWVLNHFAPHFS